jgi:hypothetical protein
VDLLRGTPLLYNDGDQQSLVPGDRVLRVRGLAVGQAVDLAEPGVLQPMRLHDWQVRFEAFARERVRRPFAWGENDCAHFAADAVQAITGQRLCEDLRGYSTAREATRVLGEFGGVRGLATLALGEPIPVLMATVGDVVVIPAGKREALAVCNGAPPSRPGRPGWCPFPCSRRSPPGGLADACCHSASCHRRRHGGRRHCSARPASRLWPPR